ncbi:MAG: hypothetical protein ACTHK7_01060 [Aureliella sp.]
MSLKRFVSAAMIVFAAMVSISTTGCGGIQDTKMSVPESDIEKNVRATLEEYEKTGKKGSNITGLESDINGIKTTDSAKGNALMEGYRKLVVAEKPEEVKAAAKEMLSKL